MPLFSKNKPTNRVEFEGGWVELQYLSKGVKSEYQNRMAGLLKDMGSIDMSKLKESNEQDIPSDIDFDSLLKKVNQAEYYKLSKAIKSWSEEEAVTEETVQDLDEELFDLISEKINEMNELTAVEEKN